MSERFEVVPMARGFKVLDWHRGGYVPRLWWETRAEAERYAARKNREHQRLTREAVAS